MRYEAKAGRAERDMGLENMPLVPSYMVENGSKTSGKDGVRYERTTQLRNPHPTVKPISLTKHLASLLLPPDRYAPRRLLVPFSGVSSECIGALLAGWEEIIGVEGEANYAKIGRTRLEWWEQRMKETGLTEPKAILKAKSKSTTRKMAGRKIVSRLYSERWSVKA